MAIPMPEKPDPMIATRWSLMRLARRGYGRNRRSRSVIDVTDRASSRDRGPVRHNRPP